MRFEKETSQSVSQSPTQDEKEPRQQVKKEPALGASFGSSVSAQQGRKELILSQSLTQDENKSHGASFGPSIFSEQARTELKKTLTDSAYSFNPALVAAIVRRKPADIKKIINPTRRFHDGAHVPATTLRASQYEALTDFYGKELLCNPFKLALKICNSENTEATEDSGPTRYDVLHVLAENFGACVADAERKDHPTPDLAEILKYAESFDNQFPLDLFINGLSDANKARANEILNPQQETFAPSLYD